jgi:hypothetical protein
MNIDRFQPTSGLSLHVWSPPPNQERKSLPAATMTQRTLELTLILVKNLKEVNLLSKMEVYSVISLSGDTRLR